MPLSIECWQDRIVAVLSRLTRDGIILFSVFPLDWFPYYIALNSKLKNLLGIGNQKKKLVAQNGIFQERKKGLFMVL